MQQIQFPRVPTEKEHKLNQKSLANLQDQKFKIYLFKIIEMLIRLVLMKVATLRLKSLTKDAFVLDERDRLLDVVNEDMTASHENPQHLSEELENELAMRVASLE